MKRTEPLRSATVILGEESEKKLGIHERYWEQDPCYYLFSDNYSLEKCFDIEPEVFNVTAPDISKIALNKKLYKSTLYFVFETNADCRGKETKNKKLSRAVGFVDEFYFLKCLIQPEFFQEYYYTSCTTWYYINSARARELSRQEDENAKNQAKFGKIPRMVDAYEYLKRTANQLDESSNILLVNLHYFSFIEEYEHKHNCRVEDPFDPKTIKKMGDEGYRLDPMLMIRYFYSLDRSELYTCFRQNNDTAHIVGMGFLNFIRMKNKRNEMDRMVEAAYEEKERYEREHCHGEPAEANTKISKSEDSDNEDMSEQAEQDDEELGQLLDIIFNGK